MADMVGLSSWAPGAVGAVSKLYPMTYKYWPVGTSQNEEKWLYSDGGNFDNLGIMQLLQRGATKAAVFKHGGPLLQYRVPGPPADRQMIAGSDKWWRCSGCNGCSKDGTAGALGKCNGNGCCCKDGDTAQANSPYCVSARRLTAPDKIDFCDPAEFGRFVLGPNGDCRQMAADTWFGSDLGAMFGCTGYNSLVGSGSPDQAFEYEKNQVFPRADLQPLLCKMQKKNIAGEAAVVSEVHTLVNNNFWSIKGGSAVKVVWNYMSKFDKFVDALDPQVRDKVVSKVPQWPFLSTGIGLSKDLVHLLAYHAEASVLAHEQLYIDLYKDGDLPAPQPLPTNSNADRQHIPGSDSWWTCTMCGGCSSAADPGGARGMCKDVGGKPVCCCPDWHRASASDPYCRP